MMAGATASGERSARLARANPVVASMAGASVTVPRRGASSATPVRCSSAVLLRARRNGGSYTSQISAAKGARPRDGSPSTPATQLAQQTRAATPLVPSFWPPHSRQLQNQAVPSPTAESGNSLPTRDICLWLLATLNGNGSCATHFLSTIATTIFPVCSSFCVRRTSEVGFKV